LPEFGLHENRRYSAVVFQHPSVKGLAEIKGAIAPSIGRASNLKSIGQGRWEVDRFEYLLDRSLYPKHLLDPESRKRRNGYAHDLYCAVPIRKSTTGPAPILIASPYVRLLDTLFRNLRRSLPPPAPQFLSVDMPKVYEKFIAGETAMTAIKVTLQMLSEKTLSLVSMSGRNPLRSDLHQAIIRVAAPYSLRSLIVDEKGPCRVDVDRHGNFWWYQSDESTIRGALSFIDVLQSWNSLVPVRSLPLDRIMDSGEEP
jgi:hypothetical protein